MPTDQQLVEEIKNGSQSAMDTLVKRYYKDIFAYVYRKLGDYHIAYDITQEVFIKMIQAIPKFRNRGKFKNWLLTIAVNQCRDYFRSSTFKQRADFAQPLDSIRDNSEDILISLSKKEQREQVKEAIHHLPEYQREAIILRFFHDLKIKEIAGITNSKESTVKSRLRQGVTKLKYSLKGGDKG